MLLVLLGQAATLLGARVSKFFDDPILNSPYAYPDLHWEFVDGQPTEKIVKNRRCAEFITPIPKSKKHKASKQQELNLGNDDSLSTDKHNYDEMPIINELRTHVDEWRKWPNLSEWHVTAESTRLLLHWRHHNFQGIRPFFCQFKAVEVAISLTEVASKSATGKIFLTHLANTSANPLREDPKSTHIGGDSEADFATMILEDLKTAGVQQAHREDLIAFTSIILWPAEHVAATGIYVESDSEDAPEKKARIFIGREFVTVAATREAAHAGGDVLVACAFNYDAKSAEFDKLGIVLVPKARMNADLHMADELKNTGKGNLFVSFGEPGIGITPVSGEGAKVDQIHIKINGVDVFHPETGEVGSDEADRIACWFIETNYKRRNLLGPPRVLPRCRRPLQKPQNHPQSRNQRRSLGPP